MDSVAFLKEKLSDQAFSRLSELNNSRLMSYVADAIELTEPESVFVVTDSDEDIQYIRDLSVKNGEENKLAMEGHTVHFDGYNDQARDKANTKYLLDENSSLGPMLNWTEKNAGIEEVRGYLKGSMKGRQMLVAFFCLGPTNSEFSIPCVQVTDSPYVAHSESILYRRGYEQFKKLGDVPNFFKFFHTEGKLENFVSVETDKRRVYIDLDDNTVYSTNTQYAGNTVGLKKLALRLAIQKACNEGWLAEHMFVMGVHGPNDRVTYFTGAFPSACGKTSTSMIEGQSIVGDDIAYLRAIDGEARCVNVEKGIFGIIRDVNPDDDPVIYNALTKPNEVIFSNILVKDGKPYWLGSDQEVPEEGVNHSGDWKKGKKDAKGNEITCSHKNARYCLNISDLENKDPMLDAPEGVCVGGVIYGGRDSDTWVPVEQAFDWKEGIIAKGASIESETTAATLGKEGVRTWNAMSNMDFVSVPLGSYIKSNLEFADKIEKVPSIFSVNYFLKDEDGNFLNGKLDKVVWVLWAELRVNGEVDAIKTPTGYIPKYEDLVPLFKKYRKVDYSQEDYVRQFTIRIPENLSKLERVEKIYREKVSDAPEVIFETFDEIRKRLTAARDKHGEYISPFDLISK